MCGRVFFFVICVEAMISKFSCNLLIRYGDNVGLYRTYLFGSPAIIACSPSANKYVFQSDDSKFRPDWPTIDLLGKLTLVAVHGKPHARLRNYVINAINQPDALRSIALLVQPRMVAALQSWAHKGRIIARNETKKVGSTTSHPS